MTRHRGGVSAAAVSALLAAWILLCGGGFLHDLTPHHPGETGSASCSLCKISEGHCAYPAPAFTAQTPAPGSGFVVSIRITEHGRCGHRVVASPRAPPLPA